MTAATVAVLGTGTMGAPMARNIAAAGLPTRVWNRTREKAEALADVATVCGSVAEAVDGADIVLTMAYDADAVLETMARSEGRLDADAVWLQCSTVGLAGSAAVADLAARLGVTLVDAPVLGTKEPAEQGALVVLASGPQSARERVEPVLDAIGGRTLWVGAAGDGQRLKLAANAWVFSVVEGVAESLALARDLGLDPALFLDAVAGGPLDAPYVQLKGKAMLSGQLDPSFALSVARKDAELILAAAREAGGDPGPLAAVAEHLRRAEDAGHGELDVAATYLAH